ncbi:prolyl-tRNA synthetase [bacterium]|nr:prolyl-tRNA synthetase [bacterium]NBX97846.1 prolyl-tRNA synthetase [bacterium]NDC94301.1 prolyl-tRNA synthetase [bacterium]NDD84317.1 prolyl-tRNA synthetase [bacterium]
MKSSQLFTRTRKQAPADETAKNAQLLIRAGFVHKEMAGVYTFLPLGKRVLENVIQIIREEMNAIGGNEISLTALQQKDVWEASGRWSDDVMDVWFRTTLANGTELGLAPTHEEPLTALMKNFIDSYKDLPSYPYQFQIKFRNELRSKSGLMRGREFTMKDLYSFSKDRAEHEAFYEKCAAAYKVIFDRLGIGDITYRTFASGGSFSKFSDEFQTVSPVGEDTIFIHEGKGIALNQEVYTDEVMKDLGIDKNDLVEKTAVEVGNIFTLGTKFSDALDLNYAAEDGTKQPVFMGSYGIGPSRLVGLLAEHFADDRGLVWPENIAPFKVYLAPLGDSVEVTTEAEKLYEQLTKKGIEVLYDDRNVRPGEKFADADLMGIPYRIVISEKTLASSVYEYKGRTDTDAQMLSHTELIAKFV